MNQSDSPEVVRSSDGLGPAPKRTEWTEVRLALRLEYGHQYTYNGVPCMDFRKHVYVGRARRAAPQGREAGGRTCGSARSRCAR